MLLVTLRSCRGLHPSSTSSSPQMGAWEFGGTEQALFKQGISVQRRRRDALQSLSHSLVLRPVKKPKKSAVLGDAVSAWGRCYLGAALCCDGKKMLIHFVISPQSKRSPQGVETIMSEYGKTGMAYPMVPQSASEASNETGCWRCQVPRYNRQPHRMQQWKAVRTALWVTGLDADVPDGFSLSPAPSPMKKKETRRDFKRTIFGPAMPHPLNQHDHGQMMLS
ncbi:uncharacterized protein LOC128850414 isoform X2 [Cuculus canorus]|uniref:uncharacterized protein LOC128850414 isoform X2 n=1 Tax=Cuculus canorus TaxID=55661 RepID=UPI0023AA6834|nr:uncharacterized protein LOC128850414 isoform X2 [Cuculus canorus]